MFLVFYPSWPRGNSNDEAADEEITKKWLKTAFQGARYE